MAGVRTDLAMETCLKRHMNGVKVNSWEIGGITVTEVRVETEEGARLSGKDIGRYVTLEMPDIHAHPELGPAISELLAEEIMRMLPEGSGPAMVVGLGNRRVTPDSLGPKTVDGTLVTRHLYEQIPERVNERMTNVCALSPGVLGVTGVETMELAGSVARAVRPRVILCVDALAAGSFKRVGTAVQLTDTGIRPGSGVGNHRGALTRQSMGVPVLALGVPTVIYAATLAEDAFRILSPDSDEADLDGMAKELLGGEMSRLIVTPREIDRMICEVSRVLAGGINRALHPGLSAKEMEDMMR